MRSHLPDSAFNAPTNNNICMDTKHLLNCAMFTIRTKKVNLGLCSHAVTDEAKDNSNIFVFHISYQFRHNMLL